MGILSFLLGRRPATAGIAKERLQIVLAHERASRDAPEFLPALQRDLLAVVGKYVAIKEEFVRVNLSRRDGTSVLEINLELDGAAQPLPRPTEPAANQQSPKFGPQRSKSVGKRR